MPLSVCPPRISRLMPLVVLLGSLWLSGCATQSQGLAGSERGGQPAEAYTQLGMAYLERDNLPRAMGALNHALSLAPNDPEALHAMAMLYERQGEYELADDTFQQAIAARPEMTRSRNNYAAFLFAQGRIREACEQLEYASADTRYAARGQLFTNLGQCQYALGEIDAARQSLARAQRIEPRNPRSYLILAELELEAGELEQAEQQVEALIRLVGTAPEALRLARDIALARNDRTTADFYNRQLNRRSDTL